MILLCALGEEEEKLIGIEAKEVVWVSEPELMEIPGAPNGVLGGIVKDGRVYTAVAIPGVGEYEIRVFVLVRRGLAIGVTRVIEYAEPEETLEMSEKAVEWIGFTAVVHGRGVPVLDTNSLEIRGVEQGVYVIKRGESGKKETKEEGEGILLARVSGKNVAVRMEHVRGIVEWEEVNGMEIGNLRGFMGFSGKVIPVVSLTEISKPKWCVVLEKVAFPIESADMIRARIEMGKDGEFVDVGGEKVELLDPSEMEGKMGWI